MASGRFEEIQSMAYEAISSVMPLGVSPDELGELSGAYLNDVPVSAVCGIGVCQELVGGAWRPATVGRDGRNGLCHGYSGAVFGASDLVSVPRLVAGVADAGPFGSYASRG